MSARRGPKPSEVRHLMREMFPEWSDRTFATYWRAWKQLADLHLAGAISDEERKQATRNATRPNGTFNVCKFARIAEACAVFYLAGLDDTP